MYKGSANFNAFNHPNHRRLLYFILTYTYFVHTDMIPAYVTGFLFILSKASYRLIAK